MTQLEQSIKNINLTGNFSVHQNFIVSKTFEKYYYYQTFYTNKQEQYSIDNLNFGVNLNFQPNEKIIFTWEKKTNKNSENCKDSCRCVYCNGNNYSHDNSWNCAFKFFPCNFFSSISFSCTCNNKFIYIKNNQAPNNSK